MRTALIYDPLARYVHIAKGLARHDKVVYFSPSRQGAADPFDYLPGIGLDGITRTNEFFTHIPSADYCVFPGVGDGDLQEYLRQRRVPVFGAGGATAIEQDRQLMRSEAEKADFEIVPATYVIGTDALREILEDADDRYIKISFLRGIMETFHHVSMKVSQVWLDNLIQKLGPYASQAEFIVEEPIVSDSCVEAGIDTFVCDGEAVQAGTWGYEVKDAAFVATTFELPAKLKLALEKHLTMIPDYRGAFSNELRIIPAHEYMIDVTHRFGLPPSQLQSAWIENFADVVHGIATGEPVEPEYIAPLGVQITLCSEWFQLHPLAVEVEIPERVSFYGECCVDEQTYAINVLKSNVENLIECGAAVGWGHTLETALASAIEAAESVSGLYVGFNKGNLTKAMDTIRTGNKLGLHWGSVTPKNVEF